MRPVQEEMAANTQDIRTLIRLVWCDVGSKLLRSIICASTVTCSVCMTVATRRIQVLLWCRWRRSSTYFKPVILVTGIGTTRFQLGIWFGSKAVALHLLVGPLFRLLDAEREHLLSRTEVSRKKQWRKAQTWRDIWFNVDLSYLRPRFASADII